MNTKNVIDEFLSRGPKASPDGYQPLTLEQLPIAIARLQNYDKRNRNVVTVDHSMERLKEQVGQFVADCLIKSGAIGAETIANLMKASDRPNAPESESKELERVGRAWFISLLFLKKFHPESLPTKAQFRDTTLWLYSWELATKHLKREAKILDEQSVSARAKKYFGKLKERYEGDKKLWRRIPGKLGINSLLPDRSGPKPKR
jgi:hypothetical protein